MVGLTGVFCSQTGFSISSSFSFCILAKAVPMLYV